MKIQQKIFLKRSLILLPILFITVKAFHQFGWTEGGEWFASFGLCALSYTAYKLVSLGRRSKLKRSDVAGLCAMCFIFAMTIWLTVPTILWKVQVSGRELWIFPQFPGWVTWQDELVVEKQKKRTSP